MRQTMMTIDELNDTSDAKIVDLEKNELGDKAVLANHRDESAI